MRGRRSSIATQIYRRPFPRSFRASWRQQRRRPARRTRRTRRGQAECSDTPCGNMRDRCPSIDSWINSNAEGVAIGPMQLLSNEDSLKAYTVHLKEQTMLRFKFWSVSISFFEIGVFLPFSSLLLGLLAFSKNCWGQDVQRQGLCSWLHAYGFYMEFRIDHLRQGWPSVCVWGCHIWCIGTSRT